MNTKQLLSALTALLALLLLSGCFDTVDGTARVGGLYPEDGDPEIEFYDNDTQPVADGDEQALEQEQEADGESTAPNGTRILYMHHDAIFKVPRISKDAPSSIDNLFILTPSEDGKTAHLTFCDQITTSTAPEVPPVEVPQLLKDALNKTENALSYTLDGAGLAEQQAHWAWGLHNLPDPVSTALPNPLDPYVPCPYEKSVIDPNNYEFDQDGDGKPGITLHVMKALLSKEGARYMGSRYVWQIAKGKSSDDGVWTLGTFTYRADLATFCSWACDSKGQNCAENVNIALLAGITDTGKSQWAVYKSERSVTCTDVAKMYSDGTFKNPPTLN